MTNFQSEQKYCQNCKSPFEIDAQDFAFYERIQVPPPTFCPQCRHIRRLTWAHTFNLYRRKCDVPGHNEEIITKYPAASPATVYDAKHWWSDAWDPLSFGFTYDLKRSFFEQLDELYRKVPTCNSDVINSVNCDYCVTAHNSKNCYFIGSGFRSEDCLYSEAPVFCKNVVDSHISLSSDTLYECIYCDGSFNLKYCTFCEECMDSAFMYNCKGCSDCFGCVNLRNKKYCIFNKQYSKKEYLVKMKEFDLSSRSNVEKIAKQFQEFKLRMPHRFANIIKSTDCTGDVIDRGKNCKNCFEIRQGAENCKFVSLVGLGVKDSYDLYAGGLTSGLLYESRAMIRCERVFFSGKVIDSLDVYYSRDCEGCTHIFACAGLRHKKYCIFNKQYSKEEYERLVPEVINHMNEMPYTDSRGIVYKFGEYPPSSFSLLPYNESVAQLYYPLNPVDARKSGYQWADTERGGFTPTLFAQDIPDSIESVDDTITSQVIECEDKGECNHSCLVAFKIVPQELQFYRRTNTPLPRLCPTCRYAVRLTRTFKSKNPIQLFRRVCQCKGVVSNQGAYQNLSKHFHGDTACAVEFETPYHPDRKEIIYCEKCYQQEL